VWFVDLAPIVDTELVAATVANALDVDLGTAQVPTEQRQSMSAASAVNARGAFWFVTYQGALNAVRFVDYLKQLMKHRKSPLTLILGSLPAHKGPVARGSVDSLLGKLQLHYPPGYAPELNPDELVWNHMKLWPTKKLVIPTETA
jgi:hypothetical protein